MKSELSHDSLPQEGEMPEFEFGKLNQIESFPHPNGVLEVRFNGTGDVVTTELKSGQLTNLVRKKDSDEMPGIGDNDSGKFYNGDRLVGFFDKYPDGDIVKSLRYHPKDYGPSRTINFDEEGRVTTISDDDSNRALNMVPRTEVAGRQVKYDFKPETGRRYRKITIERFGEMSDK